MNLWIVDAYLVRTHRVVQVPCRVAVAKNPILAAELFHYVIQDGIPVFQGSAHEDAVVVVVARRS